MKLDKSKPYKFFWGNGKSSLLLGIVMLVLGIGIISIRIIGFAQQYMTAERFFISLFFFLIFAFIFGSVIYVGVRELVLCAKHKKTIKCLLNKGKITLGKIVNAAWKFYRLNGRDVYKYEVIYSYVDDAGKTNTGVFRFNGYPPRAFQTDTEIAVMFFCGISLALDYCSFVE